MRLPRERRERRSPRPRRWTVATSSRPPSISSRLLCPRRRLVSFSPSSARSLSVSFPSSAPPSPTLPPSEVSSRSLLLSFSSPRRRLSPTPFSRRLGTTSLSCASTRDPRSAILRRRASGRFFAPLFPLVWCRELTRTFPVLASGLRRRLRMRSRARAARRRPGSLATMRTRARRLFTLCRD